MRTWNGGITYPSLRVKRIPHFKEMSLKIKRDCIFFNGSVSFGILWSCMESIQLWESAMHVCCASGDFTGIIIGVGDLEGH